MRTLRSSEGFNLVELMVVMAIVGILAGLIIPQYVSQRQQASDARIIALLDSIRSGLGAYEARNGSFSGLPSGDGATAWEGLRTALAPFVTLPPWTEVSHMFATMGTAIGWNTMAGKGQVVYIRPAQGTGQYEYVAAADGVYRCAWTGNLSGCVRVR